MGGSSQRSAKKTGTEEGESADVQGILNDFIAGTSSGLGNKFGGLF